MNPRKTSFKAIQNFGYFGFPPKNFQDFRDYLSEGLGHNLRESMHTNHTSLGNQQAAGKRFQNQEVCRSILDVDLFMPWVFPLKQTPFLPHCFSDWFILLPFLPHQIDGGHGLGRPPKAVSEITIANLNPKSFGMGVGEFSDVNRFDIIWDSEMDNLKNLVLVTYVSRLIYVAIYAIFPSRVHPPFTAQCWGMAPS